MTRFARRSVVALAAAVLLVSAAPTAHAGLGEDVMFFEIYGGIYNPEVDALDSDTTYGVRLGGTIGTRLALSGTLGYFETDGRISTPSATGPIELSAWLADATMAYLFIPDSRVATLALGGGIGAAFADFDGELTTDELRITFKNFGQNSFTLNLVGVAAFRLSQRLYVKPAFRWRWYEARDDNELDLEYTLALGFLF
jgi:hypothetical protein